MPIDPLTIREGDNAHIDLDLKDIDELEVETPAVIADEDRIRVIVVDKNGIWRYTYDSDDPNDAVVRIEVKPDDGGGPVTNRVRVWPNKDTFRSAWSPYKVLVWRNVSADVKYSYPKEEEFVVNVLSAYGSGDL